MKLLVIGLVVAVLAAALVVSTRRNDGCLPWQTPVKVERDPFDIAGVKRQKTCE